MCVYTIIILTTNDCHFLSAHWTY